MNRDLAGAVEPVLVVGLGQMGLPIAGHLAAHGIDVIGWDESEQVRAGLDATAIRCAGSLREGLAEAAVVILMVGSERAVTSIVRDRSGLLDTARPGTVVLLMSTVTPALAAELADEAATRGLRFLDTPVCRTVRGAREGNLLALVSGAESDMEAVRPVLSAFCSDIRHVGPRVGDAQVAKAVNNLLLWAAVMANEEGLRLASAYGLDEQRLRDCLVISTADNWSLREWDRAGEWPWSIKDMHIVLDMADANDLAMPLSGLLSQLVRVSQILSHADR
jgi:3-hydroxyisobutyrate dehydrogenase-like beta-hydroxyacid dehydrogenase